MIVRLFDRHAGVGLLTLALSIGAASLTGCNAPEAETISVGGGDKNSVIEPDFGDGKPTEKPGRGPQVKDLKSKGANKDSGME